MSIGRVLTPVEVSAFAVVGTACMQSWWDCEMPTLFGPAIAVAFSSVYASDVVEALTDLQLGNVRTLMHVVFFSLSTFSDSAIAVRNPTFQA